jgi:hypothetical protein
MLKKSLKFLAAPACALTAFSGILAIAPGLTQTQTSEPTTTCAFDRNSGKTNPLGMRAFVTIRESQGNTTFVYEQFPSIVSLSTRTSTQATIAQRRELIFYNTLIAAARQRMIDTPEYYSTLLGTDTPEGFAPVNAVLTCQVGANPSPSPTASPTASPTPSPTSSPTAQISKLPDGNYRYWTGRPTRGMIVTDEELLQKGGILFLFNKKGNQIIGTYGQIDNIGICLSGQINENTFTGVAIEQGDASVVSEGDRFVAWDAAGLLRVRRGSKTGERIQYNSAIADLRSFTRINAGNREPITRCP